MISILVHCQKKGTLDHDASNKLYDGLKHKCLEFTLLVYNIVFYNLIFDLVYLLTNHQYSFGTYISKNIYSQVWLVFLILKCEVISKYKKVPRHDIQHHESIYNIDRLLRLYPWGSNIFTNPRWLSHLKSNCELIR